MDKAINLGRKQDLSHLATKVELEGKADKVRVVSIDETRAELRFEDNTINDCQNELSTLLINIFRVRPDELCQVNFTSGRTPTELKVSVEGEEEDVKWTGDDIDTEKGVFVPEANRRYTVMLYSDGMNVRGVVSGVDCTEPIANE